MNQPNRKRQHKQTHVKVEQQEEESTQSSGAGINASQSSSSSNFADSNTNGTSQDENGDGNDIKEVKLKMVALQIKVENQELRARLHAKSEEDILANLKQENRALWIRLKEVEENAQTMMDAFGQKLAALEAKHQQEIARLSAKLLSKTQKKYAKRNQQQQQRATVNCQTPDSDCVVVDMEESSPLIPPPPIPPNLVACHSAQQKEEGEVLDGEEPKTLCNPAENVWNPSTGKAYMKVTLPDQLNVHNHSPTKWGNIIAQKGFLLAACRPLQQSHSGPILYYYEIKTTSPFVINEGRLCIGLSSRTIQKDSWIGKIPNTYAMQDDKRDYCLLSGICQFFDWPYGAVKPTLYGCGDVFGCGLVVSADKKLAIFFTTNGTLMGKQFTINNHFGSILYPCVQMNRNVTVEANFGQQPFKYNIDQCPGLVLQW